MSTGLRVGRVILNAPLRVLVAGARRVKDNAPYLLALLAFAAARADVVVPVPTTPGSDVTIKLSTPAASLARFGFAPVRVSIENAAAQERTWTVNFEAGMRNQYPGAVLTGRSITVPAGQSRDTWVFVPVAEPSVNAAKVMGAATAGIRPSGSGSFPQQVAITKTPTGTKVTVTTSSPAGGAPISIAETEINSTTGVMTTTRTSPRGGGSYTTTNTPPPGGDVTYTINPANGTVSSSISAGSALSGIGGVPRSVRIVTSTATPSGRGGAVMTLSGSGGAAPVVSSATSLPVVTVTDTPTGVHVKSVRQMGSAGAMTQEHDINATTGEVTTIATLPTGTAIPPRTTQLARPGMDTIITVDPTTGNYSGRSSASANPSAAPKITIVKGSLATPSGGAGVISRAMPVTPPVMGPVNVIPTVIMADISGPGMVDGQRVNLPDSVRGTPMRPFAVSASLDASVRGQLSAVVRGAPNLSAVEFTQLPADWRVWSSFVGVMLTTDEYAGLDAGRRGALRGWVGLGGRLWLVPAEAGAEKTEKFGAGLVTTLAGPLVASPVDMDLWVKKIQVFDGTPGLPERDAFNLEKSLIGSSVQEPAGAGTPLAMFLLAFAIVVGPVNLFVFAPVPKRHRLFLTTPLIAVIATLGLGVLILMKDGLGGDGMRRALVVLLPGNNEAAVFQEQASRTGFLTSRSFALADDTQVTVMPLEAYDARASFRLNTTALARADGRASGDWFRSRNRQAQLLQRLVPTRGRVERTGTAPGGAPIVQSSLATPLRTFVCVDEAGVLWTVPELPPGKRVTLTRGGTWLAAGSLGGSARFADLLAAAAPNSPGHWGARGGATDLAPIATLTSIAWAEADVVFTGVLEGAAAKEATP